MDMNTNTNDNPVTMMSVNNNGVHRHGTGSTGHDRRESSCSSASTSSMCSLVPETTKQPQLRPQQHPTHHSRIDDDDRAAYSPDSVVDDAENKMEEETAKVLQKDLGDVGGGSTTNDERNEHHDAANRSSTAAQSLPPSASEIKDVFFSETGTMEIPNIRGPPMTHPLHHPLPPRIGSRRNTRIIVDVHADSSVDDFTGGQSTRKTSSSATATTTTATTLDSSLPYMPSGPPSNTLNDHTKKKNDNEFIDRFTYNEPNSRHSSLARRIIDSAPNPTGLCVHPFSRTREPYEVEIATNGVGRRRNSNGNTNGSLLDNRRNRPARAPLLSSMDPTSSKIIGKPSALTLKQRASSVGSAVVGVAGSRALLQPRRMERYNYAKALLLSDDELERFSQKIRSEINESEMFELAQAAEKAAADGETHFRGRASTFGSIEHAMSAGQPTATTFSRSIDQPSLASTEIQKITKNVRSVSAALGDLVTLTTPQRTRTESEPNGDSIGAVNLSLPGNLKNQKTHLSFLAEPGKRSMKVKALRNINEVIPKWKELHGHLRTHLHRERVTDMQLFFDMDTSEDVHAKSSCRFPTLPMIGRHNKSRSDIDQLFPSENVDGAQEITHRRSRSWVEDIADIALPALGQAHALNRSLASFGDAAIALASFDDTSTDRSDKAEESIEQSEDEEQKNSFVPKMSGFHDEIDTLTTPVPLIPTGSTLQDTARTIEPSLLARLPRRKDVFEVLEPPISANQKVDDCSRDIYSSTYSSENVHQSTKEDPAESSEPSCPPVSSGGNPVGEEQELIGAYMKSSEDIASLSLFDDDDESSCPESPLLGQNPKTSTHQSISSETSFIPQTPAVNREKNSGHVRAASLFSTPAHLRIIKGLYRNDRNVPNDPTSSSPVASAQEAKRQQTESQTATPAVSFGPIEPNSIVAHSPDVPRVSNLTRRTRSSRLHDDDASYLALPSINGTSSYMLQQKNENNFRSADTTQRGMQFRTSRSSPNLRASLESKLDTDETPRGTNNREVVSVSRSLFETPEAINFSGLQMDEKKECDDLAFPKMTDATIATAESSDHTVISHQQGDDDILKPSFSPDAADIQNTNTLIDETETAALVRKRGEVGLHILTSLESKSGSESPVDRRWITHGSASMCHSLPSPDRNFKAVIQGVMSHFSPRKKKERFFKDFHPAAENREYLNNYFYCSKKELTDPSTANRSIDDETQSAAQFSDNIPPGQMSWTDPCVGTQQCNLFGADSLCGGFSFWFPQEGRNINMEEDISNSHFTEDHSHRSSSSRLRASSLGALEMRDHEASLRGLPQHDEKDSWLRMFQSFKFSFTTNESQGTKPTIPFSPPELARRFKRTHSR